MADEQCPYTHNAVIVRNLVHGSFQFGVLFYKILNLFQRVPRRFQNILEFQLRLVFGLTKSHLDAAVSVHVAFAGGFNRQENHVPVLGHDGRLRPVRLSGRHTTERLQRQHHVGNSTVRVVDILGPLQVPLAAPGA